MINALFFIVGLMFDLIMLAASGLLIYISFQPDMLHTVGDLLRAQLASGEGHSRILAAGVVVFVLSFRSVFLLLGRRGSSEVLVLEQPGGRITVSNSSLEHVLRRLVESGQYGASMDSVHVDVAPAGGINIHIRVRIDLVDTNLNIYSKELESVVREHFKEKLGLEIKEFNVRAEYAYPEPQGA